MKIIKSLFFVLLTGSILTSCNKNPSAGFSIDDNTPNTAQLVSFENLTVNGSTYKWSFGDGGSSTAENATHTYSEWGEFTVTLTAYSRNGKKTDSYSQKIDVIRPTFELISNLWDYNFITNITYKNGELNAENRISLADLYDIHTIEFFNNYMYETISDGSTNEGIWSLNAANSIFVIDGTDYHVLNLSNNVFDFASTETYTAGGDTYIDSTIVNMAR
jgi:hypothetical protein